MGGCWSCSQYYYSGGDDYSSRGGQQGSAYVVSVDGELRRYPLPITVSQVLLQSDHDSSNFFLCSSDRLYFNDYIPSLKPDDELEPAQIYFILPAAKLQYRLAASDMAALAVKASVALDQINAAASNRRRRNRISPLISLASTTGDDDHEADPQSNQTVNHNMMIGNNKNNNNNNNATKPSSSSGGGLGSMRSGSVRKLTKYSSRRAKLAVRSFRNKLTTIYEGSVLYLS